MQSRDVPQDIATVAIRTQVVLKSFATAETEIVRFLRRHDETCTVQLHAGGGESFVRI